MTRRARAGRLALAAAAIAVVCACGAAAGGPATAARPSRIFFAADRSPRWYGEIYRVTASGRRIDLSDSPAADVGAAVSPDGRWVAFLSARGGGWALWVVGTDGHALRRISAPLARLDPTAPLAAQIAWGPDSRTLAAVVARPAGGAALYVGARTATVRRVADGMTQQFPLPVAWSPDGRLLACATALGEVDVVTPAGKRLWATSGTVATGAWSSGDRLAVSTVNSTVSVFDRRGRLLTRFAGTSPVWSADGRLLASLARYAAEIRVGGTGHPTVRFPIQHATQVEWVGSDRLRAFGRNGWVGFDVAHRRSWPLTGTATLWGSVVSPGGLVLGAAYGSVATGQSLVRSRIGSSSTTTVAHAPFCGDDGSFGDLAFVPHGGGVLYETDCDAPPADIYSVAPDGSGLRRVTRTPEDDIEPSVSPDATTLVFVQRPDAARCDGCPLTLWSVPVAGGEPHGLTTHGNADPLPFDQNPAWSPDGRQIVFDNSGTEQSRLVTMPAAGGPESNLHVHDHLPLWTGQGIVALDWSVPTLKIDLVDPATGATQVLVKGAAPDPLALARSRDGRLAYLYFDAHGRALVAVAGSTAKPLDLSALLPPHARVAGLAWSPDGTRLAFAADDANGIGEIWTIGIDGSGLRQVTRNLGAVDAVSTQGTLSWG